MMSKISYIDSGVLINAFRGDSQVSLQALLILDEPDRQFASSPFVQLETQRERNRTGSPAPLGRGGKSNTPL